MDREERIFHLCHHLFPPVDVDAGPEPMGKGIEPYLERDDIEYGLIADNGGTDGHDYLAVYWMEDGKFRLKFAHRFSMRDERTIISINPWLSAVFMQVLKRFDRILEKVSKGRK